MQRSAHLPALSDLLSKLSTPGTFAARHSVPAEDLELEVNGVGAIRFPITPRTFAKLRGLAKPSPFGLREQTLEDPSVRSSWEISRSKVKLSARRWKPALAGHLRALQEELGLSPDQELTPVFDKLLLYAQGEFFKPHQDSEKHDDMVATLVVVLPSAYEGGAVTVEHRGKAKVFRRLKSQDKALSLLAFYADCAHSVRPITRGFRVALTYRLLLSRSTGAPQALPRADLTDTLVEHVREHFNTPTPPRFGRSEAAPPERLVYFLDHEYTERGLAWGKLKNGDRVRVAALRTAAERLACDCYLALADVQETWLCADDYPRSRHGGSHWDSGSEDEDEDEDASEYELIELQNNSIELRNWLDTEGESFEGVRSSVSAEELYSTTPTSNLVPFRTEHEGYQGNYGNTVDRWYHRAAFVMWPRSHAFVLRAEVAPEWAVDQLLALPRTSRTELASRVEALLPRWRYTVRGDTPRLFSKITKLATHLTDPELARRWLAPVGAHRIHTRTMRREIVALVSKHGLPWAKGLFTDWMAPTNYQTPAWPTLAALCEELVASQVTVCTQLARWLVEHELAGALKRAIATTQEQPRWLDLDQFGGQADHLMHAFDAATAAAELDAIDHAISTLLEDASTLSTALLCQTLSKCMAQSTALRAHLAGSALYRLVVKRLDAVVRAPLRSKDDFRISFTLRCGCADCKTLLDFLGSRRAEFDWPLNAERRQHIHQIIDHARLPLTHVTLRRGSPYVLQLRKDSSLFAREQAHRARAREILDALSNLGRLAAPKRTRPQRSS